MDAYSELHPGAGHVTEVTGAGEQTSGGHNRRNRLNLIGTYRKKKNGVARRPRHFHKSGNDPNDYGFAAPLVENAKEPLELVCRLAAGVRVVPLTV